MVQYRVCLVDVDFIGGAVKPPFVVASVLCGILISLHVRGEVQSPLDESKRARLAIEVDDDGWGGVPPAIVRAVLYSVADALVPGRSVTATTVIRVSHTDSNPVALYERGPSGEYQVQLHADRTRWHLYVYEFAHELCHILSNYDSAGPDVPRRNQWLEETLCETASLYALGRLGSTWTYAPPDPTLAAHAAGLRRYFRALVTERHRNLPEEMNLNEWLQQHHARLCDDPYQRDMNDLVAKTLLPLFFTHPDGWAAIAYLNLHPNDAFASVEEFLSHWLANAPEADKPFIARFSALLGQGPGASAAQGAVGMPVVAGR
jgi:hypothetical protein